ncbi:SLBB domain-containing protein [Candidatus Daviesbacteria bacterium]|nr:SLBB domain-containing protein [Candidatus Daviesbacteria bacterium]
MDSLTWRDKLNKFKLPIGLSLLGLVLIVGGIFASGLNKSKHNPPAGGFPKESIVESRKLISVDVSGAVSKPGVYQLVTGSRIEDVIKLAGGFTQDANQEYISKTLNLAQKLSDGSKIYVPLVGEQGAIKTTWEVGLDSSQVRVVNINTATQAELEALPGRVGPVTASNIISGRPYQAIEELLDKKIVSKSVFEAIKDSISLY